MSQPLFASATKPFDSKPARPKEAGADRHLEAGDEEFVQNGSDRSSAMCTWLCTEGNTGAGIWEHQREMVADPSGAVVPRAEVTATQTTTGLVLKTVTSGEGTYVFHSLVRGTPQDRG